jgi:hypothetical protein
MLRHIFNFGEDELSATRVIAKEPLGYPRRTPVYIFADFIILYHIFSVHNTASLSGQYFLCIVAPTSRSPWGGKMKT